MSQVVAAHVMAYETGCEVLASGLEQISLTPKRLCMLPLGEWFLQYKAPRVGHVGLPYLCTKICTELYRLYTPLHTPPQGILPTKP